MLGTPLYMGALHKHVRALLEKNRAALERTPFALFALGPIKADDGLDGSREQLFTALAKLPAPTPAATAVFVGAYGPARLGFKDRMIAALPASPLHGEVAHDDRDWDAIRAWATDVCVGRTCAWRSRVRENWVFSQSRRSAARIVRRRHRQVT